MKRLLSREQIRIKSFQYQIFKRNVNEERKSQSSSEPMLPEQVPVLAVNMLDSLNSELSSCPSRGLLVLGAVEDSKKKKKLEQNDWLSLGDLNQRSLVDHYKKLAKFRLSSFVVLTAMGGYAMAPAAFDINSFVFCAAGTGLVSAAANAINQFSEVPFDSQMSRTKNRVIITGHLTPLHSVGFALASGAAGLGMLYFGVNGLTAALGAGNFFLYTMAYTPLKRMSILNTWVGAVVGAVPPLMGWTACTGSLDLGAWILPGVVYAWQFPHFNALSWNLRQDYSRAGYRMMAVTNPNLCKRTAFRYTYIISSLCGLGTFLHVTNYWFPLLAIPINSYFSYLAFKFYANGDSRSSRKLFRFSLIHLPTLLILFWLTKERCCTDTNLRPIKGLSMKTFTEKIKSVLPPILYSFFIPNDIEP